MNVMEEQSLRSAVTFGANSSEADMLWATGIIKSHEDQALSVLKTGLKRWDNNHIGAIVYAPLAYFVVLRTNRDEVDAYSIVVRELTYASVKSGKIVQTYEFDRDKRTILYFSKNYMDFYGAQVREYVGFGQPAVLLDSDYNKQRLLEACLLFLRKTGSRLGDMDLNTFMNEAYIEIIGSLCKLKYTKILYRNPFDFGIQSSLKCTISYIGDSVIDMNITKTFNAVFETPSSMLRLPVNVQEYSFT